jgi:hydrogenase nickel incorporation protein HypB
MEIPLVRDVLEESNLRAQENRALFDRHNTFVVNIMGSPGSGKTALLEKTVPELQALGISCGVIVGDIATSLDGERLKALGVPVVQANTEPFGGDCHLGSHLVQGALKYLDLASIRMLFIENIGNLVCPAEFYLGEDCRVVVLSLAEGEDKPLKYPLMFRECNLCLVSKMDLAPHLEARMEQVRENLNRINGRLDVIPVSSRDGSGIQEWIKWLLEREAQKAEA